MSKQQLDKNSFTPLYLQLANIIEGSITSGEYKQGEKLPSEQELIKTFSVSRVTVRQTMNYLAAKDIIIRKQGLGTFVNKPIINDSIDHLLGFYPSLLRRGIQPEIKNIEYKVISPILLVKELLKLPDEEKIVKLIRQYLLDGKPFLVAEIYIPHFIAKKWTEKEINMSSTLNLINNAGYKISHSNLTILSKVAKGKTANFLDLIKGSPVLELKRLTFSTENIPVEYVITSYRGDAYEISTTIYASGQNKGQTLKVELAE
ncbi:MAG: GntR family transcriptional regulator [Dehalobacterium sp.]